MRATSAYATRDAVDGPTLVGDEKLAFVTELFDRVASRYDVVNACIALGMVDRWRRRALRCGYDVWNAIEGVRVIERGDRVLDVGCGTGAVTKLVAYGELTHLGAEVTGVDCSRKMIEEARRVMPGGRFDVGNAAKMTYGSETFDAVVTAYTLRNFPDLTPTLAEMVRCCKRGGRIMILDAFPPQWGVLGFILRMWLRFALPLIGYALTGERKAYEYLGNSIERARTPEQVANELRALGAERVVAKRLFPFGAAAIIVAHKP